MKSKNNVTFFDKKVKHCACDVVLKTTYNIIEYYYEGGNMSIKFWYSYIVSYDKM